MPLEIYVQTKEKKYLDMGLNSADKQWEDPTPDGLSSQTRYWIDDMYMLIILQLQAYRATGDARYLDRAALEMTTYLDKLQQPNGLFYHAPDVPFYWGRGDGWVAAGMAEMLRSLPENHPRRARIMESYRKMMKSLLQYQGKDGVWRQLIDHPESWPETSSTGMFTFAMITGVKNGWLDEKTYGKAARKGLAGTDQLSRAKRRSSQRVPGHRQEKRLAVLSRSRETHRRPSRTGADPMVRFGVFAFTA